MFHFALKLTICMMIFAASLVGPSQQRYLNSQQNEAKSQDEQHLQFNRNVLIDSIQKLVDESEDNSSHKPGNLFFRCFYFLNCNIYIFNFFELKEKRGHLESANSNPKKASYLHKDLMDCETPESCKELFRHILKELQASASTSPHSSSTALPTSNHSGRHHHQHENVIVKNEIIKKPFRWG
jgi:hypothetical protein